MNKLIYVALKATFGEHTENLMQVIDATNNEQVAAEILLGIYEAPVIANVPKNNDYLGKQYGSPVFKSYNPFKDEITFTYFPIPNAYGWVPKAIVSNITTSDFVAKGYSEEDAATQMGITKAELTELYKKVNVYGEPSLEQSETTCGKWSWER